jgi:hypothetical protein
MASPETQFQISVAADLATRPAFDSSSGLRRAQSSRRERSFRPANAGIGVKSDRTTAACRDYKL